MLVNLLFLVYISAFLSGYKVLLKVGKAMRALLFCQHLENFLHFSLFLTYLTYVVIYLSKH